MTFESSLSSALAEQGWQGKGKRWVRYGDGCAHSLLLFRHSSIGTRSWFATVGLYIPVTAPFASADAKAPYAAVNIDNCCLTQNTMSVEEPAVAHETNAAVRDLIECIDEAARIVGTAASFEEKMRKRLIPGRVNRANPRSYVAFMLATDPTSPEIDLVLQEVLPTVEELDPGPEPYDWSTEDFQRWVTARRPPSGLRYFRLEELYQG